MTRTPPSLSRFLTTIALVAGVALAGVGLVPAAPAHASTGYTLNYVNGRVARWNPCATIHYRVNAREARSGALSDVKTAIARISNRTGIHFHYDGRTSVIPQQGYGSRSTPGWAPPLVIAWAKPGTGAGHSNLLTTQSGQGGWRALSWWSGGTYHPTRIVTGYAVLNSDQNGSFRPGYGAGVTRGELLLHELGHAVGLGHVSLRSQIMYAAMHWRVRAYYHWGDRAGLRRVGRSAGCIR